MRWPGRRLYQPAKYWEGRATELIDTYDHPESWPARNWLRAGAEDETVPRLLRDYRCRSVLVVGVGSGRQYGYLADFDAKGFDISPTLAAESRRRFPERETSVADVADCEAFGPVDAVLSSAVLGHVKPRDVLGVVRAVARTARCLIVVREYTWLREPLPYMWAHDYPSLLADWRVVYRDVTDERGDGRAELIAFRKTAAD